MNAYALLPGSNPAVEAECREMAAKFPTAQVLRAIALAESGQLTWVQVHGLFVKALSKALAAV